MSISNVISKIKSSPTLYNLYFYIGNFVVNLLKLFLRPDEKLILFVSYGGRKYDDTPKDIFKAMLEDKRFNSYKIVWAFREPDKYDVSPSRKIKIDTLEYYKTALKARVWITNVGITRALSFTGIHTLSINSWHGTAIKYIGKDAIRENTFVGKGDSKIADIMLAQGRYDVDVYSRAFGLEKKDVVLTGFPRNDFLVSGNTPEIIFNLKKKMAIPVDKKVLLYAPTYRDYETDESGACIMQTPLDLNKWQEVLGEKYILIVRAHVAVMKVMNIKENDFIRDFTSYPYLNDILLVTDMLISDYSGILFDYSILGRPIICYTYDYEKYKEKRGLYIDIRKELTCAQTEVQLLDFIMNNSWEEETCKAISFRDKYVQRYGNSSKRVLDVIANRLFDYSSY